MQPYKLSAAAENDLLEIARYTLNTWGREELERYRVGLKNTFLNIAKNEMTKRTFSTTFPDLLVSKYKYHYISISPKTVQLLLLLVLFMKNEILLIN